MLWGLLACAPPNTALHEDRRPEAVLCAELPADTDAEPQDLRGFDEEQLVREACHAIDHPVARRRTRFGESKADASGRKRTPDRARVQHRSLRVARGGQLIDIAPGAGGRFQLGSDPSQAWCHERVRRHLGIETPG